MIKGGLGNIMKQVQKMQEKISKAQEELANIKVEGSSGGGMVTAVANGNRELLQLKMEKEIIDPEDIDMLEDLIVAAVNQALQKANEAADEHLQKEAGGMIPDALKNFKLPGL